MTLIEMVDKIVSDDRLQNFFSAYCNERNTPERVVYEILSTPVPGFDGEPQLYRGTDGEFSITDQRFQKEYLIDEQSRITVIIDVSKAFCVVRDEDGDIEGYEPIDAYEYDCSILYNVVLT